MRRLKPAAADVHKLKAQGPILKLLASDRKP